ncbi:hypothetical protein ACR92_15645, partial [Listeria monocytogenes]|nr:hypothetical protein [Listeria monocytogenes]EAC9822184.1 hypothetical protein [Listeria monocytogenes]EAD7988667.1 hypothetical protein [Listeria monocytogenes]EAE9864662.1 hypothetical protein [Listeria monocytogenes]EAF1890018.1 hypothetical protein [Listeria monocytogenes]
MKKIIIGVLVVIVLIIAVVEGKYYINMYYQKGQAKKPIEASIKASKIPKKDIYVIKENEYESESIGDSVQKEITTKKDYENWKQLVSKRKKYLDGSSWHKKKGWDKIDKCEISYLFVYDTHTKKVRKYYILAGNSVDDKK